MIKCEKCGAENRDDACFCSSCGAKIKVEDVTYCYKCGSENLKGANFCKVCGAKLNELAEDPVVINKTIDKEEDVKKPLEEVKISRKESPLNMASFILSIAGAAFTIFATSQSLAIVGITISTMALIIIAVGVLCNKIKGPLNWNIALSVYGLVGNFIWLSFIIWILPNL